MIEPTQTTQENAGSWALMLILNSTLTAALKITSVLAICSKVECWKLNPDTPSAQPQTQGENLAYQPTLVRSCEPWCSTPRPHILNSTLQD